MKKIIYLLLFIVNIACSLDLPVEDQITGLDAIDNVATANESLSGIYNAFPTEKVIFSKKVMKGKDPKSIPEHK